MHFLDNCEIFIPKFLDLYGREPATILNFKKYFSLLQSYGYINILYHILILILIFVITVNVS